MRRPAALLAASLLAAMVTAAEPMDAGALMRRAVGSAQAGDFPAALVDMQAAAARRPGHPAYLYNLACIQSLAGEGEAALATLARLADLGVAAAAAQDGDFAGLRSDPRFVAVCARFAANGRPRGSAAVAFTLPAQSGLIEGIAVRPATGDHFLGDMHHRCVWRRDREGRVTRFTADDPRLTGIGGLAVDESRGLLWAACSAQAAMAGWTPGDADRGGLAAFDLGSGELRAFHPLPTDGRHHATADLALAADGTVYLADSAAPVVWRLAAGGDALTAWADDLRWRSLQGLAVSADGRTLFVADYALGLFRIDRATGAVAAAPPPAGATLVGIDGLVRHGAMLVAVQNGVQPFRVLAITLAGDEPAAVHVLAAALPEMADPTLACVEGDGVALIGRAGWDRFGAGSRAPPTHDVPVLRVSLPH